MTRSHRFWLVAAVAVLLAMSACSTKTGGRGALGSVPSTAPSIGTQPSTPATAPSSTPSSSGNGGGGNGNGGGGNGSGGNGGGNSGPTVHVVVAQTPSVSTGNCPYGFNVHATISVKKGPIQIQYRWDRSDNSSSPIGTITYTGKGKQSFPLLDGFTPQPALFAQYTDKLVIVNQSYDTTADQTSFSMTCGIRIESVTVSPRSNECPYTATWTAVLSSPLGPQQGAVHWFFSDGTTTPSQDIAIPAGGGSVTISTSATVKSSPGGITSYGGSLSAQVAISHPIGTFSGKTAASCAPPDAQ